jgi:hypothetical protein
MVWTLALVALLARDVAAQTGAARGSTFLRFGCSQLVVERTDPIVNPGQMPVCNPPQNLCGVTYIETDAL